MPCVILSETPLTPIGYRLLLDMEKDSAMDSTLVSAFEYNSLCNDCLVQRGIFARVKEESYTLSFTLLHECCEGHASQTNN